MKFPKEMTRTLKEFGYLYPQKIDDAISILDELDKRVVILAGGTDLLNQMKVRKIIPEFVLNIKNIKELEYIRQNKGLEIGVLTTITAMRESKVIKKGYTSLYDAAEWFGTPQVRNMATVGGMFVEVRPHRIWLLP